MASTLDAETLVGAPPEMVWRLLADPRAWPTWWPAVREGRTADHRPLREGSRLELSLILGRVTLRYSGRVTLAVPPKALSWEGRGLGIQSRHEWYLGGSAGTATRVRHRLVLNGSTRLVVAVLRLRKPLDRVVHSSLKGLKRTAERMT